MTKAHPSKAKRPKPKVKKPRAKAAPQPEDGAKTVVGRPSDFTEALALEICERLADGQSLRSICAKEGFPSKTTVLRWVLTNSAFRDQYTCARELQADSHVDEIPDIADNSGNDWMASNDPDNPGWRENGDSIRRSQIRIDARKWTAARMRPKKYGDKITNELSGPDGAPIQFSQIERVIIDPADQNPEGVHPTSETEEV